MRKLDTITNLVLCVVALSLLGMAVSSRFTKLPQSKGAEVAMGMLGKQWPEKGIAWEAGAKGTLIANLNTGCHYCNESMPFYKQVAAGLKGSGISFVAEFPQQPADAVKHLAEYGVTLDAVKSPAVPTPTPTLFLLDSNRKVKKVWVGKLDAAKEQELLHEVGL